MNNIYKQGLNRKQQMFFPSSIDEYVSEDNIVRAIEEYIESLNISKLGFTNTKSKNLDGQPPYDPKLLLKIYIYGYLNRIRSSRKLETESKRNIELMWLCAGLTPSYKTIANFRKDNPKALKRVFKEFVLLLKELNLISGELIAIDGAFFRANASKNTLIMKKTPQKDLKSLDEKIENYLKELEFQDKQSIKDFTIKPIKKDTLSKIVSTKKSIEEKLEFLRENNLTQYNRTDPDAKLMKKPAHNLMAYNVQIAVDNKYKFIVTTDTTSCPNDSNQLLSMANKTKEILDNKDLTLTADKGYYNLDEIKKCLDSNIDIVLPISKTGQVQGSKGKFKREDFIYNRDKDCYICPNKKILTKRENSYRVKSNKIYYQYSLSSTICKSCSLKERCLAKSRTRTIIRWEHSNIIDDFIKDMQTPKAKEIIKKRGSIVEHPFGTIKQNLGWTHFLVRGKEKVSGENALIMFVYNFKRLINLIGINMFKQLIQAIKIGNLEPIKAQI